MAAPEILVPFAAARAHPATHLRSTLLTSSVQSIRARGHFDRYVDLVSHAHRETILHAVAGVWLPIEAGLAHYGACDALRLPPNEQYAIGQEVGDRVQGTFLGLFIRTAKSAGMTPWVGLSQCTRLYERLFQGGGVQLAKLGPKEARMDIDNNRIANLAYFRNGFRGLVAAGAALFAQRTYATEIPKLTTATAFSLKISWV